MKLVRIEVTPADLAHGEPGNACYCAAARAMRRALPGAKVAMFGGHCEINGRPYALPQVVTDFVTAFDNAGLFPDTTFPPQLTFTLWIEDAVRVEPDYLVDAVEEVNAA